MPSFGEKLKLEREKRKITLEQISVSTKIGTRMLQALEEDKFSQLPGGIFNKGFVRAYARFVGLDEDQAVADYLQASGDAAPPRPRSQREGDQEHEAAENIRRIDAISDSPTSPLPWGLFAAILLVVALALSLWSHRRNERAKSPAHSNQTTVTVPSSANTPGTTPSSDTASVEDRSAAQNSSLNSSGSQPAPTSGANNAAPQTSSLQNELPGPANLWSVSRRAKNPGFRSRPTAKPIPPNCCRQAASAPSEAGKRSSYKLAMPAESTSDSTARRSTPEEISARLKPLLLDQPDPSPARLHPLRYIKFFSFLFCRLPCAIRHSMRAGRRSM